MMSSSAQPESSSLSCQPGELGVWFDHGLGDCVQFAAVLKLYQRRGYRVRCHYEGNKEGLFRAAGIEYMPHPLNYHHWRYSPNFNHSQAGREGVANKTFENLNTETLPPIGERQALWRELGSLNLDDSFASITTPEVRGEVERFVGDLPRPLVLLHTRGTNFPTEKSIPDATTNELYRLLLDGMPGTVVLLDWDHRVPSPPHGRIRHLRRDWKHASVLELGCLLDTADLLVGIDSGPFHLANWTRCPSLGIFHHFFTWCVSLPRASGKTAVLTRDSHHADTVTRRRVWNPIEYPAPMPSAQHIARHALRMLEGSRYGLPVGRDVMIQHLVRDCQQPPPGQPQADRHNTLDAAFRQLANIPTPRIVETGCVRSEEDWSAGYFGYLAGLYCAAKGGSVSSVDITPGNCETARRLTAGMPCEVVQSDSAAYLTQRTEPIDLLYLDSLDADAPGSAEHGLREAIAGERLVGANGLIVIDDTAYQGGWTGKGAKAVPHLLAHNWQLLSSGWQCVLRRRHAA